MKNHVAALLSISFVLGFLSTTNVDAQRRRAATFQTAPPEQVAVVSTVNVDAARGLLVPGPQAVTVSAAKQPFTAGSVQRVNGPGVTTLTINLSYDTDANFQAAGLTLADIANMKTAMTFAATQFTSRFNDPIDVNINVTAVAGTGTLGQSNTFLLNRTYTQIRTAMVVDSKSADDITVLGPTGSVPTIDPIPTGNYWVSRAQAKGLGLIADDLSNDGTFTFGGGFAYTYDPANRAVVGKTDFIGVAMHEISEIMGRIGLMGVTLSTVPPTPNSFMQMDLFHYTGAATRGLNNGAGRFFSINNGATLVKAFNNASVNGGDLQDWASGTNDAFNAFSSSGVLNALSSVDLRVMDAIGFDPSVTTAANVDLSGRVTDRSGNAVRGARVTIADSRGHVLIAVTNAFGYYNFAAVPSGDTYIATATARGLIFVPRVVTLSDSIGDLNFSPQ